MSDSDSYAIEVDALKKHYADVEAVRDVSFTVRRGEVFAFLGPNGAGKTTTVEIIETLRAPTAGKVRVLGMDVTTRKRDIIPRIGVLPQGFNSFERITVGESIRYFSRLFGCKAVDADGLMDLTCLRDKRDVQFRRLSGGMKQRLGIAVALVNDPEVVFLDEPTTGLDPQARRDVWQVLRGLKQKGKTVFLTTHYMEEAELLADTVAIIDRGRLVSIGSPQELIERNAQYTRVTLRPAGAGASAHIARLGLDPREDAHGNITVRVRTAEDVRTILDVLHGAGLSPLSLDVRKPNLEEVFLGLTGETFPADAPAPEVAA